MHVAKGKNRIVWVIPRWGIVVKVPNFETSSYNVRHYAGMLRQNFRWVCRYPWGNRRFVWYVLKALGQYVRGAFRGVFDNWHERSYYKWTNGACRTLLAPTYVSLLGLVNIQKFYEPSKERQHVISYALEAACEIDSMSFCGYDGHHFGHSENFHVAGGKALVFLDYGSPRVRNFLDDHGLDVVHGFRLSVGRRRYREIEEQVRIQYQEQERRRRLRKGIECMIVTLRLQ